MTSSLKAVKDLVALVTGGASGIGEAAVRRLVENGASVVICDLPSSKGSELAGELGDKCAFVPTDVTQETDVLEAVKTAEIKFNRLDILVNCAGIVCGSKIYDFEKDVPHSLEQFKKIYDVNTTGTFNVIRLAVGLMGKNQPDEDGQRGVIINIASITAFDGLSTNMAYASSKAAIVGMTLPVARDLAKQGIRCCTIAPGVIDTPLLRTVPDEILQELVKEVPFPHRLGKADEVAHLIQSIIENPLLNGCVIRLDGALRLKHTS